MEIGFKVTVIGSRQLQISVHYSVVEFATNYRPSISPNG
jgi:hypothetical protein